MAIKMFLTLFFMASLSRICTRSLDYSNQQLTAVPPPPRDDAVTVVLNLAQNKIQSLDHTSFTGYGDLIVLNLHNNEIRYVLDGTFINMYRLEIVYMKGNRIEQLPSVFGPSEQTLLELDMWDAISDNRILTYPYFAAFFKLESLNVGGTYNLQPLDASLLPPKLTFLGLNYGSVSNFPHLSPHTPLLTGIHIEHNNIEIIPQSAISCLSELLDFEAGNNRITNFPSFVNSSLLEELILENNRISVTPREHIEGLTQLRIFELQHNRLTQMTNISYLTSLEQFNIGYNEISGIPKDLLHGLPSLITLSCEYNDITVLPDVVALLPSLQNFYVQGNHLFSLPDYYSLSSPLTFHVQDNPLICNKSLCWLRMLTWTNPTSPLNLDSPTCAEPPLVVNTPVARAHPTAMRCYDGKYALSWVQNDICKGKIQKMVEVIEWAPFNFNIAKMTILI